MSDSDLRPTCEHHHEEGGGHGHHGHGPDRAGLRASRRAFIKGVIAGGVGCSSGTPEQDREVAQAGIDKLLAALREV